MTGEKSLEELSENEPEHVKRWRQLAYDLGMSVPYNWVAPVPYKAEELKQSGEVRDGGA